MKQPESNPAKGRDPKELSTDELMHEIAWNRRRANEASWDGDWDKKASISDHTIAPHQTELGSRAQKHDQKAKDDAENLSKGPKARGKQLSEGAEKMTARVRELARELWTKHPVLSRKNVAMLIHNYLKKCGIKRAEATILDDISGVKFQVEAALRAELPQ